MRRLARLLAACLLGTALSAAAAAQSLIMGVQSGFTLDPHFLFLGPNMAAARHLYEALVGRDTDSRWVPGLAESWTALDDLAWEFKLRRGVTFHDGTPFTAEDVAFSLARIPAVPNNPGPYTANLRTIAAAEVVDPWTLHIRTDRPNPVLPGQLTNVFIVSARAAAGAGTADFNSGRAAIGTGPFRLAASRGAEGMSLARNEAWWGGRAPWTQVEIRVVPNDAARLAALLAGDLDLTEEVPTTDLARLARDPRVAVFSRPSDRVMFLLPNVGAERLALLTDAAGQPLPGNPLRDLRIRRAISLAINRTALAERALDGFAIATGQLVPEGFGGGDPALHPDPYDPEQARRLLAKAGFPSGFGLTLGCSNNRYVNDARVCQALGQMLARAGIAAKVETQPGNVFFPRAQAGRNDLPLILFGLSLSSTRDAQHMLATVLHSLDRRQALGQGNRGLFADAGLDAMIEAAMLRMDPGREDALRAAMRRGVELLAAIPLYNQVTIAVARRGIRYTPRMDEQLVATHAEPEPRP